MVEPLSEVQTKFAALIPGIVQLQMTAAASARSPKTKTTIAKTTPPLETTVAAAAVPSVSTTPTNTPLKAAPSSSLSSSTVKPAAKKAAAAAATVRIMAADQRKATNRRTTAYTRNQAFIDTADDAQMLDEDFDFEQNLALFDKRAIWDEIDAVQQPSLMRQTAMVRPKNYRHDENILPSRADTLAEVGADGGRRQISCGPATVAAGGGSAEYTTDDGLIVPAVPLRRRRTVQALADSSGLTWQRQADMLARGTAELALLLLGGARRLVPQNQHQWPTVVIVCEANDCDGEMAGDVDGLEDWQKGWTAGTVVGLVTGRQLASHGLKVCVFGVQNGFGMDQGGAVGQAVRTEMTLFDACGSNVMRTLAVGGEYDG